MHHAVHVAKHRLHSANALAVKLGCCHCNLCCVALHDALAGGHRGAPGCGDVGFELLAFATVAFGTVVQFIMGAADCARFGVEQAELLALRQIENATQFIAACVRSARASMPKGSKLGHQLPGLAGWVLRLVVQGGLRIFDKIDALHYATLTQPPALRWWDYGVMLGLKLATFSQQRWPWIGHIGALRCEEWRP